MPTEQLFPKGTGGSGGGGGTWGSITGTLSDQTDLQAELDNTVHLTGDESIDDVKTFTSAPIVPADSYGSDWNGNNETPTKNDVYDKIESVIAGATLSFDTVTITTGSLVNLAEEVGAVPMGKHVIISKVEADVECRIRLYPTASLRTDDLARPLGTAVLEGEFEPLLEVVPFSPSDLTLNLFDTPTVYNGDIGRTPDIYYVIQNRSGSTNTVQVIFSILILEA